MLSSIIDFIIRYKYIFIFYLIVIIFLYIKRKKLDFQAKIIILYRMKFGLVFIEKFVKKYREFVILLGYIGVGAGYVGLIFISYILIKNLYDLITVPATASGVSLVLPGINVPGLGVLPFWYWIIAIFIIALVHEFGHGIVAKAHGINVKNTGIVLLGPIIGAFVEPDEKKMAKEKDITQYSVLAAGPFANIILAILALLLLTFVFSPLQQSMVEPTGFMFDNYVSDSFPAAQAGLPTGTLITGINDQETLEFQTFNEILICSQPGDEISLTTPNKKYPLTLGNNPDNPGKSFLGIKDIHNEFELKSEYREGWPKTVYYLLDWISGFLKWLFILSLGIGLFNLLPLPIVDGGRMTQVTLHKIRGRDKGEKTFRFVSMFFLLVLLLNLFYPLLARLFGI